LKPSQRYAADARAGRIQEDPLQLAALARLDALHERLQDAPQPAQSLLDRLLGREPRRVPQRGLYLWGGVGRGKTYLMDLFHETLPGPKLRLHFHRFMHRVHADLRAQRGRRDPLRTVAAGLAAEARVLCFDEFFVSDIGDAMILGELLAQVFRRGVSLVATSNIEPSRLYENGLQRQRFLPAIALLEQHTEVYQLDGGVDYRLRALEQAALFHHPLGEAAEASLRDCFARLVNGPPLAGEVLDIEGRPISTRHTCDDVAWFDFAALCDGPRSQADYIEIARLYHAVVLSDVPRLTERHEDAARRFIALVDEFYDRNVKLVISAAASIADLYAGVRHRFEFERTRSRLLEMQSSAYLARVHKA
jgi:cell division protein ZapE